MEDRGNHGECLVNKLYLLGTITVRRYLHTLARALLKYSAAMTTSIYNPTARYNPTAKEGSEEASFNVDLELFNRKELATYMKVDTKTINNLVSSLSRKGLVKTSTAHRVTSYTLHPHIIHPKGTVEDEYVQGICNDFETHKKEALRRSKKA